MRYEEPDYPAEFKAIFAIMIFTAVWGFFRLAIGAM